MPPLRVLSVSRRGAASLAVDRFAGRYALGKNQLPVQKKAGADFMRDEVATRVVGGACSTVFGQGAHGPSERLSQGTAATGVAQQPILARHGAPSRLRAASNGAAGSTRDCSLASRRGCSPLRVRSTAVLW